MNGALPLPENKLSVLDDNDLIHSPDRAGFFSVFRKYPDRTHSQCCYILSMLPEVLKTIGDATDCYISQGEFKKPNRRTVNLLRMGVCWADLDYYNSTKYFNSQEHMRDAFLQHCDDVGLPLPSIIIDSGRGAYAKWILRRPVPHQALPRWNAVQRFILEKTADFGGDRNAADASRVLRIIGSRNRKTNRQVAILWENQESLTYSFDDLAFEVLPEGRDEYRARWRRENQKPTVKQQEQFKLLEQRRERDRRTVKYIFNPYTLNWNRLIDLRKLAELRGWDTPIATYQDKFLFLATCFLSWSLKPERLSQEIEQLAFEFAPTWTIEEVRAVLTTTLNRVDQASKGELLDFGGKKVDPRYRWKNKTLIDMLEISEDEQRHMLTLIGKKEKYRRNNKRRSEMTREDYDQRSIDRRLQANELRTQGMSIRKIAAEMGLSKSCIGLYLKGSS